MFTDAERRTTGIFCGKSPSVVGAAVREPQESKRVISSNGNDTQAPVPETIRSNSENSTLGTSQSAIHNESVLEALGRVTNSTKQQTLSVQTRQQPQSQKVSLKY